MKPGLLLLASATLLLAGCLDVSEETAAPATAISAETPNTFLQYLNVQSSLPAGDYLVVAATAHYGQSSTYSLTITRDDGSTQEFSGSWYGSGGPAVAGNPTHALHLDQAGGIKIVLISPIDGYLLLVQAASGKVVAEDDNSNGGQDPRIEIAPSGISSVAYAEAYYDAVDPDDERSTLTGYLQKNCFIESPTPEPDCAGETIGMGIHAVFRDAKDLGYGRNMHARRNTKGTPETEDDSFAFVVDNYVVKVQTGSANYGPINVEAAVRENREHHLGTNAIEFSPNPNRPGENIAKFYTFNKTGARITSADLDGRGVKHMPQMCWVCHGGRALPLNADGSFPELSLRSPKYNRLELDTFDYSSLPGWSRAEQEEELRLMNEMVRDSYLQIAERDPAEADKWDSAFSIELADEHYGGSDPGTGAFLSETYVETWVPAGWQQNLSRPEGVEALYKRVIEPHCLGCHALQGNAAGSASGMPYATAVNFSSWEKFYAYRSIVADYVYRRGVMPLSLRNWEDFWRYPDDKPALLASFLGDASLFDSTGHVIQPGLPVARPGANRRTPSPVQLDGSASSFARSWAWTIVSPVPAVPPAPTDAVLDDPTAARPILTAPLDGVYVLELVVSNAKGSSAAVQLTVTVDSTQAAPSSLTFVDDIVPLLGYYGCDSCHNALTPGIPVHWDSANASLYPDALARVNLLEPELSLLLVKPTDVRHGGGQVINLSLLADLDNYNTVLEWIRGGAICSSNPLDAICL